MATSEAALHFELAIQDAEALLAHVNSLGNPLPHSADVFKRAGLIMAMTAWETYVEDRVQEALLAVHTSPPTASELFMQNRLKGELKRLHNPSTEKIAHMFAEYLGVDVTQHWDVEGYSKERAASTLNALLETRGDVVHRSQKADSGPARPHRVPKGKLDKAIKLLRLLVGATDRTLASAVAPT